MKPYFERDGIAIYHGDCMDVLPSLGLFDLAFTSPPYNMGGSPWPHLGNWKQGDSAGGKSKWRNGSDGSGGVTYDDHEDAMPWPDYVAWQRAFLRLLHDHLTPTGAIFYNHKTRVIGARLWKPDELIPDDLIVRQEVIWARAGGLNFNPTAYVPTHERVYVIAPAEFRLRSKGASGAGDVWRFAQEPSDHPAPFPVELPATAIETTGPGSVIDPFCGSGTTLLAAQRAGVRAVGIEKSERYCQMAAERLGAEPAWTADSLFGHSGEAADLVSVASPEWPSPPAPRGDEGTAAERSAPFR